MSKWIKRGILLGTNIVSAPTGFTRTLPFVIHKTGSTFTVSGWTIDQNKPTGKAYYVSTTGNDSNDGLTAGAPLRKIATAIAKADVVMVYVAAGVYGLTNGFGAGTFAKTISIIATGGRVISGPFAEPGSLSFTLDGTLTHTYKVTRSAVGACWDAANLDAYGDYTALTLQASAADVEANPGSWHLDGSNVLWVRLSDDRAPDTNLYVMFNNVARALGFHGTNTLYLENIDIVGGNVSGGLQLFADAGPATPTCYANNCTFKYSASDGVSTAGAYFYAQDCTASSNIDDGFNYHAGNGALPYSVEIDCIGRDNGLAGDIDNGSTIHDGGSIVRVNGEYMRNVGANIHDITSLTQSWNLGTNVHDSASGVNDTNFAVGTGGSDTATMWLDTCVSSGSAKDIDIDTAATAYIRNFTSGGVYDGTPTPY